MNCKECKYYFTQVEATWIGECREESPSKGDIATGGYWPIVYHNQWCGKFAKCLIGNDEEESQNE